jgi:hypothetical protein
MALEATGHSVRLVAGVSLYRVARASAWALGSRSTTKRRETPIMKKWEIITAKAFEILDQNPEGVRIGQLCSQVGEALPDQNENTIVSTLWPLHTDYPESVFKPAKGVFKLVKYSSTEENSASSPRPVVVTPDVKEVDFYDPFARYLFEEEICTRAVPLGGNKFGGKWGTPDVIGKWESRPSDIVKAPTLIVSAEIKTDSSYLIEAFGQACC